MVIKCSQIIWFFSLLGQKLNSPPFPSGGCSEWLDSNEQKWGLWVWRCGDKGKDHYSFSPGLVTWITHSGMSPATSGKQLSTPLLRPIMEKPRPPANSCARELLLYGYSSYNQAFRLKLLDKHWSRTTPAQPLQILDLKKLWNMKWSNLFVQQKQINE